MFLFLMRKKKKKKSECFYLHVLYGLCGPSNELLRYRNIGTNMADLWALSFPSGVLYPLGSTILQYLAEVKRKALIVLEGRHL